MTFTFTFTFVFHEFRTFGKFFFGVESVHYNVIHEIGTATEYDGSVRTYNVIFSLLLLPVCMGVCLFGHELESLNMRFKNEVNNNMYSC